MIWQKRYGVNDLALAERAKNAVASSLRNCRLRKWSAVADLAEQHFKTLAGATMSSNGSAYLYVNRSDERRSIQMQLRSQVVGSGGKDSLLVERGATAVISQHSNGSVIFLLYPYASSVQRRKVPFVVWHLTDSPECIDADVLLEFISDFMLYSRVSSALYVPTASDRRKALRLEKRSLVLREIAPKPYLGRGSWVAVILGSSLLFAIFLSWTNDALAASPPPWYEPVAGLVALVTGWCATILREQSDATKRAEVGNQASQAFKDAETLQPDK